MREFVESECERLNCTISAYLNEVVSQYMKAVRPQIIERVEKRPRRRQWLGRTTPEFSVQVRSRWGAKASS